MERCVRNMVTKHLEFRTAVAHWLLFRTGHETSTHRACAGIVMNVMAYLASVHDCPWLSLFTRMLLGFKSRWATPAECRYCSAQRFSWYMLAQCQMISYISTWHEKLSFKPLRIWHTNACKGSNESKSKKGSWNQRDTPGNEILKASSWNR